MHLPRPRFAAVFAAFAVVAAALLAGSALRAQHYMLTLPAPHGRWFGDGCAAGHGDTPTVWAEPALLPGRTSTLHVAHLPPQAWAMLLFGASADAWGATALPLSLAPIGAPGCSLMVAPDAQLAFPTGGGGWSAPLTVPLQPALAAQRLFVQPLFHQPHNALGLGLGRGYATRIGGMPTPTSMRSSISQHGITFQFAQPVEAGQFVNGDWFVVGPVTLTGMSPPSVAQNGRVMHGAMVDPDPSSQAQGYDSTLFDPGSYSNARNFAWYLSPQNPRQLQPNQTLIKAVSNLDPNLQPALDTCAILTVVDVVPPEGSFRPAYAGADHAVRHDVHQIDWGVLRSLAAAPGMPDLAATIAQFERPWLDHAPGWATRFLHPVQNMPDYGRDLAAAYNEAALMCHTAGDLALRQQLAIRLVQIGIDFHGNVEGGAFWAGVGGHGSGRKLPILFAGALLGDVDMLRVGVDYVSGRNLDGSWATFFGEDCQTFYVQQTGPSEINWGHGGYQGSHLGMPEFGFSHTHYPENDDATWTGNSYRQCCTANGWIGAVLCARIMGLVDAWNHPALFDYTDRYAALEPAGWTRSWSPWVGAMWDLYRPQF